MLNDLCAWRALTMRPSIALLLLVAATGCDPGWVYHVTPGPITPDEGRAELEVRVLDASLLASTLTIAMRVTNATVDTLALVSVGMTVRDQHDREVPPLTLTRCSRVEPLRLPPAQGCEIDAHFDISSRSGKGAFQLDSLSVRIVVASPRTTTDRKLCLVRGDKPDKQAS
jgi:hypothetical protein